MQDYCIDYLGNMVIWNGKEWVWAGRIPEEYLPIIALPQEGSLEESSETEED